MAQKMFQTYTCKQHESTTNVDFGKIVPSSAYPFRYYHAK